MARGGIDQLSMSRRNPRETHSCLRSFRSARAQRHLFKLPKCGPAVYALSAKKRMTTRPHDGSQVCALCGFGRKRDQAFLIDERRSVTDGISPNTVR